MWSELPSVFSLIPHGEESGGLLRSTNLAPPGQGDGTCICRPAGLGAGLGAGQGATNSPKGAALSP